MRARYATALLALRLPLAALAENQYCLADTSIGEDFFQNFQWETFDDPTHGRVNYVNQSTARECGYSYGEQK
jgi:hypothetical protein